MNVAVLAVGTELLLGQTVDTNSSWIGEQLAVAGLDSLVQVKVGDNVTRIEAQLRQLLVESDAVIVCGGLGPTHDDVTRDAIARVMSTELRHDDEVADRIRAMFESRGRAMPENNMQQALVPVGATVIPQTRGTAPGLICPVVGGEAATSRAAGSRVIYAVPGVPHEMRDMMHRAVLPDLLERSGSTDTIVSRVLRTWGESESGLNERLDDVIGELESPDTPTLAFLASGWEGLKVRLTAKAPTADEAASQLDPWEARIRSELGDLVFGVGDDTMESVILDLCRSRGWTLGLAESVTGGLVGARITGVPGASEVFVGSIVSYATEVKQTILGVAPGPVVSADAARQMALGARDRLGADVALSLTGVAGPDEQDDQPVGTLLVGLIGPGFDDVRQVRLPGQREQMRQFAVITSLDMLRRELLAR